MRLLVAHRRAVLDAAEHVADIGDGPGAEMAHRQARLVVQVRVAVDLALLLVHQRLHHEAVHAHHLRRGEFVRVEAAWNR